MILKYKFWEYLMPILSNSIYVLILLIDIKIEIKYVVALIMVISNLSIHLRYTDLINSKDLKIYELIDKIAESKK